MVLHSHFAHCICTVIELVVQTESSGQLEPGKNYDNNIPGQQCRKSGTHALARMSILARL